MRFLAACSGLNTDTTPIWIMRQAGRYLPEYRALRERVSFLDMCRTPSLAAEATLQPMRRFDLDAAIIFSDILVVVEAMGLPVEFYPEPRLASPVCTADRIGSLHAIAPEKDTPYVLETVALVRAALAPDKAVIGFGGAPFTLACYMVEGGVSHDFEHVRSMMVREPILFNDLLRRIEDALIPYLLSQVQAGADAIQLFDTWAGILSPSDFLAFALPAAREVIRNVRSAGVPVIYYMNGVGGVLEHLCESEADVISIDHRVELQDAIRRMGMDIVVQGNLDPAILLGPFDLIRERAASIVSAGRTARGHIFNLGHGIMQHTPPESVAVLVDEVHRSGRRVSPMASTTA